MLYAHTIFSLNETGGRSNNEDAICPRKGTAQPGETVFVVCDGVGGNTCGEVAAALVSEAAYQQLKKFKDLPSEAEVDAVINTLIATLKSQVSAQPEAAGMSTTLVFACIGASGILTGWCGDSRVYHLRNGEILFHSADHSLVGKMLSEGLITEEEAARHPSRHMILRSVNAEGHNTELSYHRLEAPLPGDVLLLCTDGLLETIDRETLRRLLTSGETDLAAAFDAACRGRTKDNYSMILVRLEDAL